MGRIASKPNADLSLAPIGRSITDFVSIPYGDYCEFSNGGTTDIRRPIEPALKEGRLPISYPPPQNWALGI